MKHKNSSCLMQETAIISLYEIEPNGFSDILLTRIDSLTFGQKIRKL